MTVKCGNCKGTHDTSDQVKQCYFNSIDLIHGKPDKEELEMEAAVTHTATIPSVQTKLSGMPQAQRSKIPAHLKRESTLRFTELGVANLEGNHVMDGRYAVVMDGEQVTLRFHTPTIGKFRGVQLVTYLFGPDNTESGDWVRFANHVGNGYRIWGRFLNSTRLINAVRYMSGASVDELIGCGEAYALESSNCWRCGRDLTVEESIIRGMGPVCAEKVMG